MKSNVNENKTSHQTHRNDNRIFNYQAVDLSDVTNQQAAYWQRKNNSASMKVRSHLLTQRNTPDRTKHHEDTSTVVEELESFDSRVTAGRGASFKYPNVELKRCFDAKKFRQSNSLVQRMLSTRASVAKNSKNDTSSQI